MAYKCYKCDTTLSETLKVMVARSDSCPKCMTDLRVCRMCQFYDSKAYNNCREPSADRITDKEKANFCDYFKIGSGENDAEKAKQEALAKAMALFKK